MIDVEVLTPQREVLHTQCAAVTLPGLIGEMQVLEGHTPMLIQLKTGILIAQNGANAERLMVSGGFAEIDATHVRVLAEVAARPEEINAQTEQELIDHMKKKMEELRDADAHEFRRLEAEVERSAMKMLIV